MKKDSANKKASTAKKPVAAKPVAKAAQKPAPKPAPKAAPKAASTKTPAKDASKPPAAKPKAKVSSAKTTTQTLPEKTPGIEPVTPQNIKIPAREVLGESAIILQKSGTAAVHDYLKRYVKTCKHKQVGLADRLLLLGMLIQQSDPKNAMDLSVAALEHDAENMNAAVLLGTMQDRLGLRKESRETMLKVTRSAKSTPEQVLRAANLLVRFGDQEEALNASKKAYNDLNRPLSWASSVMYIARATADWQWNKELVDQIRTASELGQWDQVNELPRTHLQWCDNEAWNVEVVKRWSERAIPIPRGVKPATIEPLENRRIRLGYLSSDFRDHPTSRLANGAFRNHDRSKFEMFMFCSGWDDGSAMRCEVVSHFDHVISVTQLDDKSAADLIRSHKIDVLVELNGPTRANRMGILAHRPAPVQVDYLGWPGSVGGRVVDYVIADEYTLPRELRPLYPEGVIYVQHTYQINDYAGKTLPPVPSRSSLGLPDGDIRVIGMFNNINKVDGEVCEAWMRILKAVPNSVLWILDPGPLARKFIAREVTRHGMSLKRVLAAPKLPQDAHLARMQACDLMLDPWPYGGHTSTSDALFAGVPVVSLEGKNFASRVCGGLLKAAGMGVLVKPDVESYITLAVELLSDPAKLAHVKRFIAEKVPASSVFNAELRTRQLEKGFVEAAKRVYQKQISAS